MPPPPAKFTVRVKKNSNTAVVRPPFDKTKKSGSVEVTNKTGDGIIVRMPGDVFGTGSNPTPDPIIQPIADGVTHTFNVHADADEGVYDFSVFCQKTFSFAQANSDPEFIIE